MDCLIADTLIGSLTRLSGEEQKAAKTTAFDLQLNPANPGMDFYKLDQVRDKISGRCGSFFSRIEAEPYGRLTDIGVSKI